MPIIGTPLPRDYRQSDFLCYSTGSVLQRKSGGTGGIPSAVDHDRHVDRTEFRESGVDITHLGVQYPVVRATGNFPRLRGFFVVEVIRPDQCLRPGSLQTNAMAHPPNHRAASRGTLVVVTGPFVIFLSHLIQHARANQSLDTSGSQLKINDAR
jgi:hypothetical protein